MGACVKALQELYMYMPSLVLEVSTMASDTTVSDGHFQIYTILLKEDAGVNPCPRQHLWQ